jgi:integrase
LDILNAPATGVAEEGPVKAPWKVEVLPLPEGGVLPVIRHTRLWSAAPLALRYALAERHRMGEGSLIGELRALCVAYHWSEWAGYGFLEDWICAGQVFSTAQMEDFKDFATRARPGALDVDERRVLVNATLKELGEAPARVVVRRLRALMQFLDWAVEPSRHGGVELLQQEERDAWLARLDKRMRRWRAEHPAPLPERAEPLTPLEVSLCRRAIGADRFGRFPAGVFTPATRFRNWAMFEYALNYGTRISELLLTRVQHLPDPLNPSDQRISIAIPRERSRPDAPGQRVKTPRLTRVPPMDARAYGIVRAYQTTMAPEGRQSDEVDAATDRLFVTARRGAASPSWSGLSITRAEQIFLKIGRCAWATAKDDPRISSREKAQLEESLARLTPHRLRHTWAEQTAYALYSKYGEDGFHRLQTWGGWSNRATMEHYCQYARARVDEEEAEKYYAAFSVEAQPQSGRFITTRNDLVLSNQ